MIINKSILTTYQFPSFQALALGQMVTTVLVLFSLKCLGVVQFPELSTDTLHKIWPLPVFHLGNLVCGLGGTKSLSLPMLVVLRRFAILITMIGRHLMCTEIQKLYCTLHCTVVIFQLVMWKYIMTLS